MVDDEGFGSSDTNGPTLLFLTEGIGPFETFFPVIVDLFRVAVGLGATEITPFSARSRDAAPIGNLCLFVAASSSSDDV